MFRYVHKTFDLPVNDYFRHWLLGLTIEQSAGQVFGARLFSQYGPLFRSKRKRITPSEVEPQLESDSTNSIDSPFTSRKLPDTHLV
jgi:hypothetical protein